MAKGYRGKGRQRGPVPPRGGPGGMLEQVQKLQEEMLKTQESLGDETVTATAGGGVVTVVMTGHQQVQSITIDPEVVDPEDVEMLQDLVLAAVNEAVEASKSLAAERMGAFTGGLDALGDLGNLLG
jgi:DNA-binding YbaB/EbfC family protein